MGKSDKKELIVARFDYDILTVDQQTMIRQKTDEIRERLRRSAQDIWEVGQRLADVRAHLKYGQFESWLKAEFGWSRRTAYNFINVYETFRDRTNLSQVNIATSALYLLASPSVSSEVRQQYLEQAQSGQRLNHKDLVKQIQQEKSRAEPTGVERPQPWIDKPEIIRLIPQSIPTLGSEPALEVRAVEIAPTLANDCLPLASVELLPSQWYCLGQQHYLMWGDTAAPEFIRAIPTPTLAIAITFHDWDHDWLVDSAKNLIVLNPETFSAQTLTTLITLLSQPGDIIVFPWLPHLEMITIADRLGRKVFAGDSSKERCQSIVQSCGLSIEPADLQ
jgi:Protein of unknown function (DUF3102)